MMILMVMTVMIGVAKAGIVIVDDIDDVCCYW
jgi:hypothetical protein